VGSLLVEHSGAGFTSSSGALAATVRSMGAGEPDSQYRPSVELADQSGLVGAAATSDVSMEAARAPAVAPSCSAEFWYAR
jgi:hypothetical protein